VSVLLHGDTAAVVGDVIRYLEGQVYSAWLHKLDTKFRT
jgi:hypothetical protein